jgi:hypothetical protein
LLCPRSLASTEAQIEALSAAHAENKTDFTKLDWLCPELNQINQNNAPGADDIDEDGVVDKVKLEAASSKLFAEVPTAFFNVYQLRQVLERFSAIWGFHTKTRGSSIMCHFSQATNEDTHAEYENDKRKRLVSPASKRKSRIPENSNACPCIFRFCPIGDRTLPIWLPAVYVTSALAVHRHTCSSSALETSMGAEAQRLLNQEYISRAAGEYSVYA